MTHAGGNSGLRDNEVGGSGREGGRGPVTHRHTHTHTRKFFLRSKQMTERMATVCSHKVAFLWTLCCVRSLPKICRALMDRSTRKLFEYHLNYWKNGHGSVRASFFICHFLWVGYILLHVGDCIFEEKMCAHFYDFISSHLVWYLMTCWLSDGNVARAYFVRIFFGGASLLYFIIEYASAECANRSTALRRRRAFEENIVFDNFNIAFRLKVSQLVH